jgi:hypothetical protein
MRLRQTKSCFGHWKLGFGICPWTWLRVMSPSTLLRPVSESNGASTLSRTVGQSNGRWNYLGFGACDLLFGIFIQFSTPIAQYPLKIEVNPRINPVQIPFFTGLMVYVPPNLTNTL